MTGECTDIYSGHISETRAVYTVETRNFQVPNNKACDQIVVERKKNDKQETCRADQGYMKDCMKKRRTNADFKERENQIQCKITTILKQLGRIRKQTSQEGKYKRKQIAENPDHIKEIAKKVI